MCIIIDTNCFDEVIAQSNDDMSPVYARVSRRSTSKRNVPKSAVKVAYSNHEKFEKEMNSFKKHREQFRTWSEAGKLRQIESVAIEAQIEQMRLEKLPVTSDDEHILALAREAKATLLVTRDRALIDDFTNKKLVKNGKVYNKKRNKQLLEQVSCP